MPWLCATHLSHSVPHAWSNRCIAGALQVHRVLWCVSVRASVFFSETHIRCTYLSHGATYLSHTVHTPITQCHLPITHSAHTVPPTYHIRCTCLAHTYHTPITHLSHSAHTYHTPITHLSHTYHTPITHSALAVPLIGHL